MRLCSPSPSTWSSSQPVTYNVDVRGLPMSLRWVQASMLSVLQSWVQDQSKAGPLPGGHSLNPQCPLRSPSHALLPKNLTLTDTKQGSKKRDLRSRGGLERARTCPRLSSQTGPVPRYTDRAMHPGVNFDPLPAGIGPDLVGVRPPSQALGRARGKAGKKRKLATLQISLFIASFIAVLSPCP